MTKNNTRSTTSVDMHVGKRLRTLRREHDLSQSELGKYAGVKYQQIQKYEDGVNRISVSRLWKFCQFFNVRPDYFFVSLANADTQQEDVEDLCKIKIFL
ncbi:helix-turn-helix domain-containing protein [Hellea sp.]|nr:helix-turn-helix domain-containing protein [Hellea sp.]